MAVQDVYRCRDSPDHNPGQGDCPMDDDIIEILENIDRLSFLCLSCTVEERQKYLAEISESVQKMRRMLNK